MEDPSKLVRIIQDLYLFGEQRHGANLHEHTQCAVQRAFKDGLLSVDELAAVARVVGMEYEYLIRHKEN